MSYNDGDCYDVELLEAGLYQVRHFPDRVAGRKACCTLEVRITAADLEAAVPDTGTPGLAIALTRAMRFFDEKHAGVVDNNSTRS